MSYEILPHTADIGVAASAATLEELFSEAARGTAAILLDADPPPSDRAAAVDVRAGDLDALFAEFLEECLYRYEMRGELVVGARLRVEDNRAAGEVLFCTGLEPAGTTIKAVTYHGLRVERTHDGWRAEAYFDV